MPPRAAVKSSAEKKFPAEEKKFIQNFAKELAAQAKELKTAKTPNDAYQRLLAISDMAQNIAETIKRSHPGVHGARPF